MQKKTDSDIFFLLQKYLNKLFHPMKAISTHRKLCVILKEINLTSTTPRQNENCIDLFQVLNNFHKN